MRRRAILGHRGRDADRDAGGGGHASTSSAGGSGWPSRTCCATSSPARPCCSSCSTRRGRSGSRSWAETLAAAVDAGAHAGRARRPAGRRARGLAGRVGPCCATCSAPRPQCWNATSRRRSPRHTSGRPWPNAAALARLMLWHAWVSSASTTAFRLAGATVHGGRRGVAVRAAVGRDAGRLPEPTRSWPRCGWIHHHPARGARSTDQRAPGPLPHAGVTLARCRRLTRRQQPSHAMMAGSAAGQWPGRRSCSGSRPGARPLR